MESNNDNKGLTKAQQFLRDVGLFTSKENTSVVQSVAVADNILHFLGYEHNEPMVSTRALPIHINNLINTYGFEVVKEAFQAEIAAIEAENE